MFIFCIEKLAKLAPGYSCTTWHAVDVSTVFDIVEAEPAPIRKVLVCDHTENSKMNVNLHVC